MEETLFKWREPISREKCHQQYFNFIWHGEFFNVSYIKSGMCQCGVCMFSQYNIRNILLIFLATLSSCAIAVDTKIVLVSSEDTYHSKYGCWLYNIYSEAFSRLGYKFLYQGVPGGRAPILAEDGSVDGEIHRAFEYQQQTTNLIRVNESHFNVTIEAYVYDNKSKYNSWHSLDKEGLRVEFRRGSKRAEDALSKLITSPLPTEVNTTEQGLKKLIKGRVDVFVEQTLVFDRSKQALLAESTEYNKIYSAGIVDTLAGYAYLNKKHSRLAKDLALMLKKMKTEGRVEQLQEQFCYYD